MSNQYNENDIAQFLEEHPEFFKNHIGLLATMYLPNAHGGGTVSLAERQQAAQRDKIREIERKYTELLEIGIENDAIINKMHQLALSLLKAATLDETIEALISTLQNEFNVPMVSLKLWASTNESDEFLNIKVNKEQTLQNQFSQGRRPHVCWENIYKQIPSHCEKIYDGTFENISTFNGSSITNIGSYNTGGGYIKITAI